MHGTRQCTTCAPDYREVMRRLVQLSRTRVFPITAIAVYFFLRMTASVGQPLGIFPDSQSYESVVFIGETERFWAIPLFYSVFTNQDVRVFLQVCIGVFAWSCLALLLSQRTKYSRIVLCATLILGLAPQIIRYDVAMLSESLGISFAVLLVTLTISVTFSRSGVVRIAWWIALILVVFTRPTHLVVITLLLAVAVIRISKTKGARGIPLVIALSCVFAWGFVQLLGNKPYSTLNFYTVLMDRVVTDQNRYNWFVKEGMPDIPEVRTSIGYDYAGQLDPALQSIIQLPSGQQPPSVIRAGGTTLAQWVISNGWETYVKYLATHPTDSLQRLSDLSSPTLAAQNDDFLPLENGAMFSRSLFMPWKIWAISGLFALAVLALRPNNRALALRIAGMALTTTVLYAATVLTAGIEHQRHVVTTAVLVRVLALIAIVALLPAKSKEGVLGSLSDERAP